MPTECSFHAELFDADFWDCPAKWPHDPPGYLFLARSYDQIGHAVHGDRWNHPVKMPEEPECPPVDCDDVDCDDSVWEASERAHDEWERSCDEAEANFQNMREGVARTIIHQCESNELVAAARAKHGGQMIPLKWHDFNVDDPRPLLFRCEIQVQNSPHWIFIMRDSLDKFLTKQSHSGPPLTKTKYLSPYLKLMISVTDTMRITPDNQPKKGSVEAEIQKGWAGSPPLSENLRGMMATLIREPSSQRGRAKKS
jgi:hypothetical protein